MNNEITKEQLEVAIKNTQNEFEDYFRSVGYKPMREFKNYLSYIDGGRFMKSQRFDNLPYEIKKYFNNELSKI